MSQSPSDERSGVIVSTLLEAFEPLMEADPQGFRTKFRKMARDPFAFYRGTACLFYADVGEGGRYADFDRDWVDQDASRIWIQGDLHAENFGTYLDADGRLVFDVNDFDEAYLGHWTLGPGAVLRQPGAALLAEGAARRGDRRPGERATCVPTRSRSSTTASARTTPSGP